MKPGTKLRIQMADPSHRPLPLGGVILDLRFFVRGTERYRFDAGETNAEGSLVVKYDDMDAIRKENQKFALMDYNTKIDECDDSIVICAPSESELEARLKAFEKWYPDSAYQLQARIAGSVNKVISVEAVTVSVHDAGEHPVELICERK